MGQTEEEEEIVQEEEVIVQNEANTVPQIPFTKPPPTFIKTQNQQEEDMGGQPDESNTEPLPLCSQSQNKADEDICRPTCSPSPTCIQPQNKVRMIWVVLKIVNLLPHYSKT